MIAKWFDQQVKVKTAQPGI